MDSLEKNTVEDRVGGSDENVDEKSSAVDKSNADLRVVVGTNKDGKDGDPEMDDLVSNLEDMVTVYVIQDDDLASCCENDDSPKPNPPSRSDSMDNDLEDATEININVSVPLPQPSTSKASAQETQMDDSIPSTSTHEDYASYLKRTKGNDPNIYQRGSFKTVNIYGDDTGPKWYNVYGNSVSRPIKPWKLPEAFASLPIHGRPPPGVTMNEFLRNKQREFIGGGLTDDEFAKLEQYCSPDHLKTGKELIMLTKYPTQGLLPNNMEKPKGKSDSNVYTTDHELWVVKKHRMRLEKDPKNHFTTKLKYRGVKLIPPPSDEEPISKDNYLEPGKDIVFHIRVYRPFFHCLKNKPNTKRHSVFSRNVVMSGRQVLTELRDRLVCPNDLDLRVDISENPTEQSEGTSKEMFPSGFLFINNMFYVDMRDGCKDHSAVIRDWAKSRGMGNFKHFDMGKQRLDQLVVRLGHPEVYYHQGNCEHLFTFSSIRLLNFKDPLSLTSYPYTSALSQNQTVYCTTCAEYGAKYIVTGSNRVPFDPAFFCETCFKMYMYKDGKKVGDFKAYMYMGNEMNVLKSQAI